MHYIINATNIENCKYIIITSVQGWFYKYVRGGEWSIKNTESRNLGA